MVLWLAAAASFFESSGIFRMGLEQVSMFFVSMGRGCEGGTLTKLALFY